MKQGKYLLTSLLIAACILATVLFFTIAPTATYTLSDLEDLNSTLDIAIEAAGLPLSEFKKTHLEIDSTFSRSVYEIKVHPLFQKQVFILHLIISFKFTTLIAQRKFCSLKKICIFI